MNIGTVSEALITINSLNSSQFEYSLSISMLRDQSQN